MVKPWRTLPASFAEPVTCSKRAAAERCGARRRAQGRAQCRYACARGSLARQCPLCVRRRQRSQARATRAAGRWRPARGGAAPSARTSTFAATALKAASPPCTRTSSWCVPPAPPPAACCGSSLAVTQLTAAGALRVLKAPSLRGSEAPTFQTSLAALHLK